MQRPMGAQCYSAARAARLRYSQKENKIMSVNKKNKRFLSLPLIQGAMAVVLILGFSATLLAATTGHSSITPSGKLEGKKGTPIVVPGARLVNMENVPQATSGDLAARPRYEPDRRPLDGLTEEQYAAMKREAAHKWPANPTGSAVLAGPDDVHTPSVGAFVGWDAQQESCCTPPDMALAVSENFVVQVVNTFIAVYDKRGNLQSGFPKSIDSFFGLPNGRYTTDPRAIYDWVNHRFVLIMITDTDRCQSDDVSSLLIAASVSHDPRGGWYTYSPAFQVGNTGECTDYPGVGHDSTNWGAGATKGGVYVSLNQFKGGSFIQNYVFLIPKDPIYVGAGFGAPTWFGLNAGGTLVDTLQPANMTDRSDKPAAMLMVNSFNIDWGGTQCRNGCNGLIVWTISNPFGSGSLAGVIIGTANNYYLPPNADEPNGSGGVCSGCIDTGDVRISGQVKYNAGTLWGSLNTGIPNSTEAGPIWFEVHPTLDTNGNITAATERQEDCFVCNGWANNGSAFYATLQPDPEGNVVMVFEYSTDTTFPTVAYTSRRVNYGDSLMNGVGLGLQFGSAFYNQGRWGDYTATAPDLTVPQRPSMWFSGQYANGSGNWGTAIGAARYVLPSDQ
jgi:hypothetical protein